MKINQLMNNVNPDTFIYDYCKAKGIVEVDKFLNPSIDDIENPSHYDNMDKAFLRLCEANDRVEMLGILADSDADGLFSSSLLYCYLKDIEYQGDIRVFQHKGKFHGLTNEEVLNQIKESGVSLLFIPDAGSSDFEQHRELKDLGIDTIVLDHHSSEKYSEDAIVINNQLSNNVLNKSGSGTLVTKKFTEYCDMNIGTNDSSKYYDIVCFANIADVMEHNTIENSCYCKLGMQNLKNEFLIALIQEFIKEEVTPKSIGWSLLPKLNSALRLGNQEMLFNALVNPNSTIKWTKTKKEGEKDYNIVEVAISICKSSHTQQAKDVKKSVEELSRDIDPKDKVLLVFADEEFNRSYTGLVAGKLASQFGKPCMLTIEKDGLCKGSMRANIPLREALNNSNLFEYNAGHETVFGTCFKYDKIDDIRLFLNTLDLNEDRLYDVVISLEYNCIPSGLWRVIDEYRDVWAKGIEEPVFHIKRFDLSKCEVRFVGRGGNVLNLLLPNGKKAIKFFLTKEQVEDIRTASHIEFTCRLTLNDWNGEIYEQYEVEDFVCYHDGKKELDWSDLF